MILRTACLQIDNCRRRRRVRGTPRLPVSYGSIAIKYSLRNLLLERMLPDLVFIDGNAQAGLRIRRHGSGCFINSIAGCDYVMPPGNIVMHRFTNNVVRLCEPKLKRGGSADWALGIMRRQGNLVGHGQGRHTSRFSKSAAVRDIDLADIAAPPSE